MANIEKKLIMFLADPQFSKEEINKLRKSLTGSNIDAIFTKARKIKTVISNDSIINTNIKDMDNLTNYEKKIINETSMLLRDEAGMSVRDSIYALSKTLGILPPSVKLSFQDQVLYLLNKKNGSDIITAANIIRNSVVHNPEKSHWPLLDNE